MICDIPEVDTLVQVDDIPHLAAVHILQMAAADMLMDMRELPELQVDIPVLEQDIPALEVDIQDHWQVDIQVQQQVDRAGCTPYDHHSYSYRVTDFSSKMITHSIKHDSSTSVSINTSSQ